jgi:hypothetical protein
VNIEVQKIMGLQRQNFYILESSSNNDQISVIYGDHISNRDTRRVQDPLELIFYYYYFALQCHLLASCGVTIFEVSAVAGHNFITQASLNHVF